MANGRTNLDTVITALLGQLRTTLGFPAERVKLVQRDDDPWVPQADQYLLVRCRQQRWDTQGGGRFDLRVKRRTTVTLRTRLFTDEFSSDLQRLTDPTLGQYVTEHALFAALDKYQPMDTDGSPLLYMPIHAGEATQAETPPQKEGWTQAAFSFDLCFVLDVNQTIQ